MKIYAACLSHETSSFSPIPTTRRSFEEGLLWWPRRGVAPPMARQSVAYTLAAAAESRGHDVWAGLHAMAQPSGPMIQHDWTIMRDELLADLAEAGPVDAILLMLHGAQMATETCDCEGDLLARIRDQARPHVVIGVELDLHANLSPAMVEAADFILPCREYPHIDFRERAEDLLILTERMAAGEITPVTQVARVPILGLFHTTKEPMREFVDKTAALEEEPGILAIALTHGFSWADTPFTGATVSVTTDGDQERASRLANELADEFYRLRKEIAAPLIDANEAFDIADAADSFPIVIAEVADNPGGGAAGDATHMVGLALERQIQSVLAGMVWDPMAVETAKRAGIGARIPMRIGGKTSPASGDPLDLTVEVIALSENSKQIAFGAPSPIGPTAAVRCGGVTVVLAERRDQVHSPECFTALGLDPADFRIVIVKSAQHFHAAFAPISEQILYADTPGSLCGEFDNFQYNALPRPIWPLDTSEARPK